MRPEALGNRCPLHLGLLGTVKDTLEAVLPAIKEKTDTSHLDDALADYEQGAQGSRRAGGERSEQQASSILNMSRGS